MFAGIITAIATFLAVAFVGGSIAQAGLSVPESLVLPAISIAVGIFVGRRISARRVHDS